MGKKDERYASRRGTPWDDKVELTPTQAFIAKTYEEHYMQRHPMLSETGEVSVKESVRASPVKKGAQNQPRKKRNFSG